MKPLFVLCVILSLLFGACTQRGQAPPSVQPAATAKLPKQGGTLVLATVQGWGGNDPAMGQTTGPWPYMGGFLMRLVPETWEVVPDIAERWQYSPDGKELTIFLRKGVKFHNKPPANGREVEAQDVVYSLKVVAGNFYPQIPPVRFPRRAQFDQMVDVVAVDKYTVKIILSEPSATLLNGLAEYRGSHILPEGIREHFGNPESLATPNPATHITAGEFVFTKYQAAVEAEFERNPDFWEQGKPYLDKIRIQWIPDMGTTIAAFIADQIHTVSPQFATDRNLLIAQRPDANIVAYEGGTWDNSALNLTKKPWSDVRVRKAIAMVMDPIEAGENTMGRGTKQFGDLDGKPLYKIPGPLAYIYPEAISQEELAKHPNYEHPKSEKTIAEARRLMAEAGYPNGFEFEMLTAFIGACALGTDGAILTKRHIETALPGMKVNLKVVEFPILQKSLAEGTFDMTYYGYTHDATAVAMFKNVFHSKGGRNYQRYSNPRVDQLLDQAARELGLQKRKELMEEAQRIVMDEMPMIPTSDCLGMLALQPYVKGMRLGAATSAIVWYKEWWLDK